MSYKLLPGAFRAYHAYFHCINSVGDNNDVNTFIFRVSRAPVGSLPCDYLINSDQASSIAPLRANHDAPQRYANRISPCCPTYEYARRNVSHTPNDKDDLGKASSMVRPKYNMIPCRMI